MELKKEKRVNAAVSIMKKPLTKTTIMSIMAECEDQTSLDELKRILEVDLVAAEARYHVACFKIVCHPPRSGSTVDRPRCDAIDKAMETVYSYISENADECQFSLLRLINKTPMNSVLLSLP